MSREWEPGDDIGPIVIDWNGTAVATLLRTLEKHYEPGYRALWSAIHRANAPSPLAVIDPEDGEAVERLLDGWWTRGGFGGGDVGVDNLQAALREYANPKPPKPDEPQGLGAVVEDEDGRKWVRVGVTIGDLHWRSAEPGDTNCYKWRAVAAVRVLSAGVEVSA